jgi:pyruvate dehydrogenase E2 component (dihydrolipoamide acetyltransferase)
MSQIVEVAVPDIGDFKDVEVIEVLVRAGDTVAKEQSLITVESDKASMEIPSSHAGTVKEMRVKLGDKVSQGSVVLVLDADAASAAAPTPAPAPAAAPAPVPAPAAALAGAGPLPPGAAGAVPPPFRSKSSLMRAATSPAAE